jgi:hypothetical protein
MRRIAVVLTAALLVGCGVDSMTAAATAAALKKQEMEQGKKTMDQAQQRIKAATDQMQQSAQKTAEAAENN